MFVHVVMKYIQFLTVSIIDNWSPFLYFKYIYSQKTLLLFSLLLIFLYLLFIRFRSWNFWCYYWIIRRIQKRLSLQTKSRCWCLWKTSQRFSWTWYSNLFHLRWIFIMANYWQYSIWNFLKKVPVLPIPNKSLLRSWNK